MESLSTVSQPVQQKHLGQKKDVEEKKKDGKPLVMKGATDEGEGLSVFALVSVWQRRRWISFGLFPDSFFKSAEY